MPTTTSPVFAREVFATSARREPKRQDAIAGFSQVFASILSAEMRHALLDPDKGPMGINGGASGDIYGSFFDQAMAKALASSRAMKPLNDMIGRELDGPSARRVPAHQAKAPLAGLGGRTARPVSYTRPVLLNSDSTDSAGNGAAMPADARGPLLLPPRPSVFTPLLPPPGKPLKEEG